MRICGVIAEYNPFHMGHAYHLRKAREAAGCDYLIVAMSGSFVQRGEIAISDKWSRAACALRNGADLAVELPARFAVRSADAFARGGVGILARLGADSLCFGAESNLTLLMGAAQALEAENEPISQIIRAGLARGETLARARGEAVEAAAGISNRELALPNNALAVEYIRANMRLKSPMEIYDVRRLGDYHSATTDGEFASASAVRALLRAGDEAAFRHVPPDEAEELRDRRAISNLGTLDNLMLLSLRQADPNQMAELCDAGEGVERRLWKAAREADSWEALLDKAKCKRYTRARLRRVCAQNLLGLFRRPAETPQYARVLGFRRDAGPLMRYLKENGDIRLCADAAALKDCPDFRLDARATDLFGLCTDLPILRTADRDYRHPPMIV